MKILFHGFIASLLLTGTFAATADVLSMDVMLVEPPNSAAGIIRPSNGMTREQVRQLAGSDYTETAAVGDPPISSWAYPAYTVYFEYDRVLTSVLKR